MTPEKWQQRLSTPNRTFDDDVWALLSDYRHLYNGIIELQHKLEGQATIINFVGGHMEGNK
jgi:hypothetical protein